MKKYLSGLVAVIIAFAAFSFTNVKNEALKTNYYWFSLNGTTGAPKSSAVLPPFQSTDPNLCGVGSKYCSGAYNSYVDNGDGTYSAGGARQITDMKP